jgi:hypothetical protein
VTTTAYPKTDCGIRCSNVAMQPKYHTYVVSESASRLLIILVIMIMLFGRINAFNEMYAGLKD